MIREIKVTDMVQFYEPVMEYQRRHRYYISIDTDKTTMNTIMQAVRDLDNKAIFAFDGKPWIQRIMTIIPYDQLKKIEGIMFVIMD